ncbi:MAG: formylglycine-generating enzyme family protein [Alphaproteobacteria bacterium]|nr:formylglycine-generating enzyme family protein [Alphaproteobacteria bacterium]
MMRRLLPAFAAAAMAWTTQPALAQEAGERFRDCPECPEMVVLPEGSFIMGSPAWEGAHREHETPARRIGIARRLAVGVHEVTFAEWDACLAAGGCGGYSPSAPWGRGRQPVVHVSWFDAKAYAEWLSRQTGRDYRLPTEAEWEYAARAGTAGPYHTGSRLEAGRANYGGSGTKPAGSYPPNAFGLHDMLGNVWEWVEDCWNPSHAGAPADGSARLSGDCNWRVLRGGSWLNGPESLRSAARFRTSSEERAYYVNGFRVALTLAR